MAALISINPCNVSGRAPSPPAVMVWSRAVLVPATALGVPPARVPDGHDRRSDGQVGGVRRGDGLEPRRPFSEGGHVAGDPVAENGGAVVRPVPSTWALTLLAFSMTWVGEHEADEVSSIPVRRSTARDHGGDVETAGSTLAVMAGETGAVEELGD